MITYQEETYDSVVKDIKPLLEKHYEEVVMYQEHIPFNPNYELYKLLNTTGQIHFFTARDDKELIGYVISLMQPSPHSMDHIYAINDMVYVKEDYRHTEVASTMLSKLEQIMKADGVSMMSFHMHKDKPFTALLESLEYDEVEILYMKYIKDE